ncbi:hypothetical protein [Agrobacterium tumefaciens]|nr:hypothetical protein [Agrobacterium tumefaciens]
MTRQDDEDSRKIAAMLARRPTKWTPGTIWRPAPAPAPQHENDNRR